MGLGLKGNMGPGPRRSVAWRQKLRLQFVNNCQHAPYPEGRFCEGGALDVVSGAADRTLRGVLGVISDVHRLPSGRTKILLYRDDIRDYRGKILEGASGVMVPDKKTGKPSMIVVSRTSPTPELTMAHEFGHYLDTEFGMLRADKKGHRPAHVQDVLDAIDASSAYQSSHIRKSPHKRTQNEAFARAYAQYIALRSDNKVMQAQVRSRLADHWEDEDFEPIARAFDSMFQELGWRD